MITDRTFTDKKEKTPNKEVKTKRMKILHVCILILVNCIYAESN